MRARISELESRIDFLNSRFLCSIPEKQEKYKGQIRKHLHEHYNLTKKHYVLDIQKIKYDNWEY
ncbi:hypothetical protein COU54_02225 [Candidatus Pacearchaeota archaeon CG10_big_fil_rev_8_21_14_0_10_31_24]|nr:MAG: hypothetical protein COU54_02225 [Candidatus Pacearchaeota archaeon CG10_big_fil_rev_8_21_14_0_10_31_24]